MENLVTFSRGSLRGTIKRKKFEAFAEILTTEVICKPVHSKIEIYEFIKHVELLLYWCDEFDNLYFFYKIGERLFAIRYYVYFGSTEISDIEITNETKLKACNWGYIQVFIPHI